MGRSETSSLQQLSLSLPTQLAGPTTASLTPILSTTPLLQDELDKEPPANGAPPSPPPAPKILAEDADGGALTLSTVSSSATVGVSRHRVNVLAFDVPESNHKALHTTRDACI